jgi:hypothetical protein
MAAFGLRFETPEAPCPVADPAESILSGPPLISNPCGPCCQVHAGAMRILQNTGRL